MESKNLRDAGLKVTLPRLKILEMLEKSETRHLSAEEIYRMLIESGEEIGLATVYRVLTQFESAGLITRHHFEGGHAVFELDEARTTTTSSACSAATSTSSSTRSSRNASVKRPRNWASSSRSTA